MSISLKRIELSNIRSHESFTFVPAETGVTAISGPTGSGKSTIVDSLAWVLFGTKPNGVSKNSSIIREGTDPKTHKSFVRAEIEVDGCLLKIERRLLTKAGGAGCDVWEWDSENEEWEHLAGAAVSHAESYIRQRMKMDEKGFLTAILVQQKQVDQLISSGPRERAQVIEDLTGLSSITSAVSAARQEHTGLKKASQLTDIDEGKLKAVESEILDSEAKLDEAKTVYKKSKAKIKEQAESLGELESSVELETEKFEKVEAARRAVTELDVKIESRESLLEETLVEKEEAKAQLPKGPRGMPYSESLEQVETLRSAVSKLTSDLRYQKRLKDDAQEKAEDFKQRIENSGVASADEANDKLASNTKRLSAVNSKMSEIEELIGNFGGEINQFQSAIKIVAAGDDCPTCLQKVDETDAAVAALEASVNSLKTKRKKAESKLGPLSDEREELTAEIASLKKLKAVFEGLDSSNEQLKVSEKRIADLSSTLKSKEAELKASEKLHKSIEQEEERTKRYDRALERLQKIVKSVDDLKAKRKVAKRILKEGGALSETKLNSLRKRLYDLRSEYQDSRVSLSTIKADAKILASSIDHLTDKRAMYQAELDRHKELLKSVEISAATLETLSEFRINRVKTALPTIESFSSELLTRFTDGKFIGLKLDEKFNASVTLSDGTERAVGLLSGGELSAASIALRLSVSMMLNGSDTKNLIILDEVLVSQDADRAELILSTIRDVCKGQVVMIAHGDGLGAIADKRVEMEEDKNEKDQ